MKRILQVFLLALCFNVSLMGQSTSVVRQFGQYMSEWASGQQFRMVLEDIESICSEKPAVRFSDKLAVELAKRNNLDNTKTYTWGEYRTWLQKEIDKGIKIDYFDITSLPKNDIDNPREGYNYVSGNIKVSGALNVNETSLFLISKDKIVSVQDYVTTEDIKTGRKKIEVDWDDLGYDDETSTYGLSYNYGLLFPVGFSLEYTYWRFMIALDLGFNFQKDSYTTQKVEFNNIMDYKITKGDYDLKGFVTLTPAFYMKYFAVGWGFGTAYFDGKEYMDEHYMSVSPDGSIVSSNNTSSGDATKYKFMMRPTIKGYIPCSDNFFISLNVSYDWILGYNKKNGVSFGAGIHFLFD